MAMMQRKELYKPLLGAEKQPNEPAPLANGASKVERNRKVLREAYQKEFIDISEKRNNVWCHLSLTLDATILMQMRYDCVGDGGIRDSAYAWKFLQEKFRSVETSRVVILVAQPVRQQPEDFEDLDRLFIRGQKLPKRLQEAGEAAKETFFNASVFNVVPTRYHIFAI